MVKADPGGGGAGEFVAPAALTPARMIAFSDAVFAIALTLLVLSLTIPPDLKTGAAFRKALEDVVPSVFAYAVSFSVISSFWLAHHRAFLLIRRVDQTLLVLNLAFLGVVAVIPFPTDVLGTYNDRPLAVMLYAATMALACALSTALWWYASRNHRLIDPATPPELIRHAHLRGLVLVAIFAGSIPLALVDPALSTYSWALAFAVFHLLARRFGRIHSVYRPAGAGEVRAG